MIPLSPELVEEVLRKITEPALKNDLVSLKMVKSIAVEDGRVRVNIELMTPAYMHRQALESQINQALKAIPGVREVQLEFTAHVKGQGARPEQDRLPGVKHIIAVAAGKGGVGKSTVAVNLALALQRHGAKVGLLDADIYGPSIPKMLGEAEAPSTVTDDKIEPARYYGMKVMSVGFFVERESAVIWRGPMVHKLLQQFSEDVAWGELDYLIVDLPPGTGDAQLSLSQLLPLSGALMVTTPQEVALADVVRAVAMFKRVGVPVLGVIENMSYHLCSACGHRDEIFSHGGGERLAGEVGVPFLGNLPILQDICTGGDQGHPLMISAPEGEPARLFMEIAARLATNLAVLAYQGPRRSPHLVAVH